MSNRSRSLVSPGVNEKNGIMPICTTLSVYYLKTHTGDPLTSVIRCLILYGWMVLIFHHGVLQNNIAAYINEKPIWEVYEWSVCISTISQNALLHYIGFVFVWFNLLFSHETNI